MKISLASLPILEKFRDRLTVEEFFVDPGSGSSAVSHSVEVSGDHCLLVIDHSCFTAKLNEFRIFGEDAPKVAREILDAVQLAIIRLQENTLAMLATVNGAVINSLDEKEIVHNVLREVMHVLPHSEAGVFRLFDSKSGFLEPVSYVGLPDDYRHYRLLPNESVSGEVFSSGRPAIHNGRQKIIDAHRVMRPESQSFMERSDIANALLCVPVIAEGRRLGTLTTLCFSPDIAFSKYDQTVLEFLAAQIAVAYQRSIAYQNAVATSQRLEELRADLERKNADLDRVVELHDTLLLIFSTEDGLTSRFQKIEELYGVSFRFESMLGFNFQSEGWTERTGALEQTVEVAETRVGKFVYSNGAESDFDRVLFGTLSAFVALDFVRDLSRMDVANSTQKALFDALADGSASDTRQSNHAFRPNRYHQVLVASKPSQEASDNMRLSLHRMQSDLQKMSTVSNTLTYFDQDQHIVLVSASTTAALERNMQAMSSGAESLKVCLGASEIYEDRALHAPSRRAASDAAKALVRRGRPGLLRQRDMGLELLFEGRERKHVLGFMREVLAPLDEPKHQALHATLIQYIAQGKSITSTAEILGIHPNTLYQRLQRIETLTGKKISNPADFTLLSLACQLHVEYEG